MCALGVISLSLFVYSQSYFMVGYTITWTNCLTFYAGYALFQVTSESIGLMTAACTTTAAYATLALTFVLLILLSFSGFLVQSVPVYFRWVSKISYLTYALAAIVVSQFNSTEFVCETGEGCEQGAVYPGSSLIPSSVDNGLSPGINLLVLLGITVGCRVLALVLIYASMWIGFL
jgi:ABC-type multidrug transport system permease subunit